MQKWQSAAEAELSGVAGYVTTSTPNESSALFNLVMDVWLFAHPADIAMPNSGAIRQGIPAGDITKGTVLGMMPFENTIVALELTGSQVVDDLQNSTILSGMTTLGG